MDNALENQLGGALTPSTPAPPPALLTQGQKAAVIVRLLLTEEVPLPLERLTARQQQSLAECMTQIRRVDRATLASVVDEFVESLDGVGLTFPRGIPDALEMLEPYLSPDARGQLQSAANQMNRGDAWSRIAELEVDEILHLIEEEGAEVCAILMSKLPVAKAAELLGAMPIERAEIIAHSVALTGSVGPQTVRQIGLALAQQLDARPAPEFRASAADRVGSILNASNRKMRDSMLERLDGRDGDFADAVRRTIFTFDHIPHRVESGDVAAIMRAVDGDTLNLALAMALEQFPLAADFIFDNISKRMAETLREEATALGKVPEDEGEQAMTEVINAIRELEAAGEIKLAPPQSEAKS